MMNALTLLSYNKCKYDILSLGEVMLRLDPGEERIKSTRHFRVWEGGGEYNVARGLRRCFNKRAAIVTAFAKNEIGMLIEDLIFQGGVDTSLIKWADYDGIGRAGRNGLNFTERGFGIRGAIGCSDRGNTMVSKIKPGEIDWEYIFGTLGVVWFHTGGIFASLSENTGDVIIEAAKVAKKYGTIISYDLNYRPSLWRAFGGVKKCQQINRKIANYVDVMLGNEEDFTTCLGIPIDGATPSLEGIHLTSFKKMIEAVAVDFPKLKIVATTIREAKTASINNWGALCWTKGAFYSATQRDNLEILDRIGGGDSFASGFIYGLMTFENIALAVEYGAAHGALAMTTPGDTSMATLKEVEKLVKGLNARVER